MGLLHFGEWNRKQDVDIGRMAGLPRTTKVSRGSHGEATSVACGEERQTLAVLKSQRGTPTLPVVPGNLTYNNYG